MKNVYSNVLGAIGNTPLIRINRINPNPRVTVYAKLESRNPGGSIKDRAALYMIEAAEREGLLTPDKVIIEATSGNTGIGLATVAAVKGYRITLAMPETASVERQKILKALGAELLLTPGALGTDGSIEEVYRLVRENPDKYFMPDQFNNPANPIAHQLGTGPEIYEQTDGKLDVVVVTLGTTGTVMGILRAMKDRNPAIQVIGVEPYPGHKIQGLKNMKESYVPGIFDRYALDAVIHVKDEEAFDAARRLAREEGLFVGMSSGAAMAAAVKIAQERDQGVIVTIFPDGGDRYLSTNLFTTMLEPDFRFYDQLQRDKVDFKPVREGTASVFVTGPPLDTPLSLQESRRFILADLLVRFLKAKGFNTNAVVLIPDLDSRTIHGACEAQMALPDYTHKQLEMILNDLDRLNVVRAQRYPRTSDHIDAIIHSAKTLLAKGAAYEKLRSVYFNIGHTRTYGSLSGVDLKKIRLGTTVDLDAYEKINPRDFTLLKRATLAELKRGIFIKSDWGSVLPTWHIAAATVAMQELGNPVDIQVSSVDFIFPHLENVRAISEALSGKPHANVWMVCEQMWSGKDEQAGEQLHEAMSIRDLLQQGFTGAQIRYWLLSVHYCKPLHVAGSSLHNTLQGFRRLHDFVNRLQQLQISQGEHRDLGEWVFALEQNFFEALSDNLNLPRALAAMFQFVRRVNPLLDSGEMSLLQSRQVLECLAKLDSVLGILELEKLGLTQEEEALIRRREQARTRKEWAEADQLRTALEARGIRLLDTLSGPLWERID
jgi:cysteinyl-tRNA synthetase